MYIEISRVKSMKFVDVEKCIIFYCINQIKTFQKSLQKRIKNIKFFAEVNILSVRKSKILICNILNSSSTFC